jgi:hypothetical protein
MKMKRKVFTLVGLVLSFVLLGEVAPRLLIGPNVKTFQGEQRAFAASAWKEARYFFSGSAEPLFWTAIQVHDVREKTDADGQRCYEADVRAYTLFGLPWSFCPGDLVQWWVNDTPKMGGGLSDHWRTLWRIIPINRRCPR